MASNPRSNPPTIAQHMGAAPEHEIKKRKNLTDIQKLEICKLIDKGESKRSVAKKLGINESTVRGIYQKKAHIKSLMQPSAASQAKRSRNQLLIKTEILLMRYIERQAERNLAVDTNEVMDMAKEIYVDQAQKMGIEQPPVFLALKEWFSKFMLSHKIGTKSDNSSHWVILGTPTTSQDTHISQQDSMATASLKPDTNPKSTKRKRKMFASDPKLSPQVSELQISEPQTLNPVNQDPSNKAKRVNNVTLRKMTGTGRAFLTNHCLLCGSNFESESRGYLKHSLMKAVSDDMDVAQVMMALGQAKHIEPHMKSRRFVCNPCFVILHRNYRDKLQKGTAVEGPLPSLTPLHQDPIHRSTTEEHAAQIRNCVKKAIVEVELEKPDDSKDPTEPAVESYPDELDKSMSDRAIIVKEEVEIKDEMFEEAVHHEQVSYMTHSSIESMSTTSTPVEYISVNSPALDIGRPTSPATTSTMDIDTDPLATYSMAHTSKTDSLAHISSTIPLATAQPSKSGMPPLTSMLTPSIVPPINSIQTSSPMSGLNSSTLQQQQGDEFHQFGLAVASQLRMMPLKAALEVQLEIQRFITAKRMELMR